ncbi:G2/mitotic-specific cyclin-B3 [Nymphon striatum]|nr:G2/mitotic-specific cyclin-B3 [Nymphon striatum]
MTAEDNSSKYIKEKYNNDSWKPAESVIEIWQIESMEKDLKIHNRTSKPQTKNSNVSETNQKTSKCKNRRNEGSMKFMAAIRQTRALLKAQTVKQGPVMNTENLEKALNIGEKRKRENEIEKKNMKRTAFVDLTNASKNEKISNSKCKTFKKIIGVKRRKSNVPVKKILPVQQKHIYELPPGVKDFDEECHPDPNQEPLYAKEIFRYYLSKEKEYKIDPYMIFHTDLNPLNRSILVDWMVEVQESFELNHETLYLAVKLVDLYLMKTKFTPIDKGNLQLLGTASMFLASKFDERTSPLADDFLYICEDAYTRKELFTMEIKVLKVIDYKLGIPLSYRFLRRYARAARLSIEILTLARFILETSLMFYDLVCERDSLVAAAALSLALRMKFPEEKVWWTKTLEYYSGCMESEFRHLIAKLNSCISNPINDKISVIKTKYSHPAFFNVSQVPPLQKAIL